VPDIKTPQNLYARHDISTAISQVKSWCSTCYRVTPPTAPFDEVCARALYKYCKGQGPAPNFVNSALSLTITVLYRTINLSYILEFSHHAFSYSANAYFYIP